MKKLILILVVILFACEKDDVFCWNCRRNVFTATGHYSVIIEICDRSESDIQAFENQETYMKGSTTVDMTCWKKGEEVIPQQ